MSLPEPTLVSGEVYKIISVATGGILTVTYLDGAPVHAVPDKDQLEQKWRAEHKGGDKWTLKSIADHLDKEVFLTYPASFEEGSPVEVAANAVEWDITQWETRGGAEYRIWVPGGTELLIDLKDYRIGPVHLRKNYNTTAQYWLFQKVVSNN
ncbi:hypothetical protein H0H93_010768 [Arthromyces matolae]|nr:hypothetical protein H0H93_010768 [Arthromyces matolae]